MVLVLLLLSVCLVATWASWLCSDECPTARNGKCEDGSPLLAAGPPDRKNARRSKAVRIRCDLGTDCTDCGRVEPLERDMATIRKVMPSVSWSNVR